MSPEKRPHCLSPAQQTAAFYAQTDSSSHKSSRNSKQKKKLACLRGIELPVLVVPHSNTSKERVFDNKKELYKLRSLIQLGGSFHAIVRLKMTVPEQLIACYYKREPSKELLMKCKLIACKLFSTLCRQESNHYQLEGDNNFCI